MILGILKKPQNFAEWLDAATWNLVPSANARVRPEIEAHYAESVNTHLANGSSESVAHAAALKNLGDAYAAGLRFRRQYPTLDEIQRISHLTGTGRKYQSFIPSLLLLNIAFRPILSFPNNPLRFSFFVVVIFLQSLALLSDRIPVKVQPKAKMAPARLRRILWGRFVFILILGTTLLFLEWYLMPPGVETGFRMFLQLCAWLSFVLPLFFLYKKLESVEESDLPPSDPTAS